MGSFQQVLMGFTCLAAAFFFGRYLHNRPTADDRLSGEQAAVADPLESIFSFKHVEENTSNSVALPNQSVVPGSAQNRTVQATLPAAPVMPAIDESERTPAFIQNGNVDPASTQSQVDNVVDRKPVVPDFSELAARFQNSPLALPEKSAMNEVRRPIHQSERVPASVFDSAPELVIRKPENTSPIKDFTREVNRIESSIQNEFATQGQAQNSAGRWRVNRTEQIDQFRQSGNVPVPDFSDSESIEDVLSRRSADYLKEADEVDATFATDPIRDNSISNQRQQITRQAAERNRDILEGIADPGNRFKSVLNRADSMAPPEPDAETAYYVPTRQPVSQRRKGNLRPIRRDEMSSNWNRQSNIQAGFANVYQIQPGDTLQNISMRFYGSPEHYLDIYKANRKVLDQITSSPAGVEIEIPVRNN